MGAGILPTSIHNNELYFLFGKENKYEKSAPGYSDFGGGTDDSESYIETAIRESQEELTGFLGDTTKLINKDNLYFDNISNGHNTYRMFIVPYEYDTLLPFYYNNNQQFLQKRLNPDVIKNSKIFEKEEIKWVPFNDLEKMKPQFRFYFVNLVIQLQKNKDEIYDFVSKALFDKKNLIKNDNKIYNKNKIKIKNIGGYKKTINRKMKIKRNFKLKSKKRNTK